MLVNPILYNRTYMYISIQLTCRIQHHLIPRQRWAEQRSYRNSLWHGRTGRGLIVVLYPDPDSHSCGWITSVITATWKETAVLNFNSVHSHQNVGEPIRFGVCNNCISSLLSRIYWECVTYVRWSERWNWHASVWGIRS